MGPSVQERRSQILEELKRNQIIRIAALSKQLGVSEVLIRRDLERLRQQGLLKRVHGGAVALPGAGAGVNLDVANVVAHLDEKERIGAAAAELICPGDRLIFDSGSTPLQVARHIPGDLLTNGRLTAITMCLPIVQEIGPWKGVQVLLLGGMYIPEYQVVAGPQTIANIGGLHADKMFVGTDGLTLSHGVTTAHVLEAEVARALARASSQIIVVADSSKIGRIGLSTIMPLNEVHVLVTDRNAPADFVSEVRALGVQIILA